MICDVQNLAAGEPDLPALAERLSRQFKVVIATEVGGGVVPVDAGERDAREAAGRLACLLAQQADTVVRVFGGLPMALKGEVPGGSGCFGMARRSATPNAGIRGGWTLLSPPRASPP